MPSWPKRKPGANAGIRSLMLIRLFPDRTAFRVLTVLLALLTTLCLTVSAPAAESHDGKGQHIVAAVSAENLITA